MHMITDDHYIYIYIYIYIYMYVCMYVCTYVCMSVAILAQGLNTHFLGTSLSSGSGGLGGWGLGVGRFIAMLAQGGHSAPPDASSARCPLKEGQSYPV